MSINLIKSRAGNYLRCTLATFCSSAFRAKACSAAITKLNNANQPQPRTEVCCWHQVRGEEGEMQGVILSHPALRSEQYCQYWDTFCLELAEHGELCGPVFL